MERSPPDFPIGTNASPDGKTSLSPSVFGHYPGTRNIPQDAIDGSFSSLPILSLLTIRWPKPPQSTIPGISSFQAHPAPLVRNAAATHSSSPKRETSGFAGLTGKSRTGPSKECGHGYAPQEALESSSPDNHADSDPLHCVHPSSQRLLPSGCSATTGCGGCTTASYATGRSAACGRSTSCTATGHRSTGASATILTATATAGYRSTSCAAGFATTTVWVPHAATTL
jgi:hypothetical protein